MIASISRIASGQCIWCCQKTNDAIDASFKDGLKGMFCRKHFWEALKSRSNEHPQRVEAREPAGKTPSA